MTKKRGFQMTKQNYDSEFKQSSAKLCYVMMMDKK